MARYALIMVLALLFVAGLFTALVFVQELAR